MRPPNNAKTAIPDRSAAVHGRIGKHGVLTTGGTGYLRQAHLDRFSPNGLRNFDFFCGVLLAISIFFVAEAFGHTSKSKNRGYFPHLRARKTVTAHICTGIAERVFPEPRARKSAGLSQQQAFFGLSGLKNKNKETSNRRMLRLATKKSPANAEDFSDIRNIQAFNTRVIPAFCRFFACAFRNPSVGNIPKLLSD